MESNNNYYKSFKSRMEMVRVHSGKPWILDFLRSRILGKAMEDNGWTDISMLLEEQVKELDGKTDKHSENKLMTGLFVCKADNGR